jgi:hypothetical protein
MPFSIKKIEEHLTPFLHPSKHVLHCQNCYLHMCQDTGQLLRLKIPARNEMSQKNYHHITLPLQNLNLYQTLSHNATRLCTTETCRY